MSPSINSSKLKVWIQTKFDAPAGNDPVAIDFSLGMGKGEAWALMNVVTFYSKAALDVIGQRIYVASNGGCTDSCDYRGPYKSNKCLKKCGKPSQTMLVLSSLQSSLQVLELLMGLVGALVMASAAASSNGALAIVQKSEFLHACVGSKSSRVGVSINTFGDPCKGVTKSSAVEASCA
uniref:Uncharacterized protein n=1 Tax=Fagus sylvatica TaxID=28930 RepID=A0A2N9HPT1_FAGSY